MHVNNTHNSSSHFYKVTVKTGGMSKHPCLPGSVAYDMKRASSNHTKFRKPFTNSGCELIHVWRSHALMASRCGTFAGRIHFYEVTAKLIRH